MENFICLRPFPCYCRTTEPKLVEPELYGLLPEPEAESEDGALLDFPHTLRLSPALGRLPGLTAFKAVYRVGYASGEG
ncbi:MAG: hypothetical protein LBP88_03825 [Treponema sp.]|nr:hypothetical protein [Treponema sp.]